MSATHEKLKLQILTPSRILLRTEAAELSLPVHGGYITVLPGHVPYVSVVEKGEVKVALGDGQAAHHYRISSGLLQVEKDSVVSLFAETIESAAAAPAGRLH